MPDQHTTTTGAKGPGRFRKKPVEVEAVEFTGTNHDDVAVFMGCDCRVMAIKADCPYDHSLAGPRALFIRTLEGSMRADRGDWIIRGVAGEFYPCKPDIFDATYEPAEQDHPALSLAPEDAERLREIATSLENGEPATAQEIDEIRALAKNLGDGGQGEALTALAEEMEATAEKWQRERAKCKQAEADNHASGKLPAGHTYEATWNYYEGLAVGAERAARSVR